MPAVKDTGETSLSLASVCKNFQNSVKHPEVFLSAQPKKEDKFKNITKSLYDLSVKSHNAKRPDPNILPELILDSMDEEQIWQQLELRNNKMMSAFLQNTSRLLSMKTDSLSCECRLVGNEDSDAENGESLSPLEMENEAEDGFHEEDDEEYDSESAVAEVKKSQKEPKKKKTKKSGRKSVVDDEFFKLSEMEEFLKAEDEKEFMKQKGSKRPTQDDADDSEEIDYFKDDESEDEDEEEEDMKYGDFFDQDDEDAPGDEIDTKTRKRKRSTADQNKDDDEEPKEDEEEEEALDDHEADEFAEDESGEENDEGGVDQEPKSSFEERQERLRQRIKEQEEMVLSEKPWQLKGEITSTGRPQNSLLEEILEFDSTTRPAPVITEETTMRLEDIIRQRIKDKAWDDVERKYKPVQTPQELRKKLVLDQEKSKESLAQVYEKEYRNQLDKLNPYETESKDDEPVSHKEIRKLMRAVFIKLDALSNFHYTPKSAAPELRIVTNTPAVEVEEVAPVAVSTAKLLAPEEVRYRAKGDVLGQSERDRTDKNRERRKKKSKQKLVSKAKEAKLEAKQQMGLSLSSKEEKSKLLKNVMKHRNVKQVSASADDGSAIKSSKSFFTQLQDKAATGKDVKHRKKAPKEEVSAKRLKL